MKETIRSRINYYGKQLANNGLHIYSDYASGLKDVDGHFAVTWIPAMTEYVEWLLKDAMNQNIKRLYFLSRDGWMPYLVAHAITSRRHMDIECRYLRVSRYSLRVPEYHLLGEQCVDRICTGGIDVTFDKMMKRAALTETETDKVAGDIGYHESYNKVLSYREVMGFKEKLTKSSLFMEMVNNHSKAAYDTTIAYLKSEGMLDNIEYAIVDSGWIGTIQQSLKNLLKQEKKDIEIRGYYFGLYEIPEGEKKVYYNAYFFEPLKQIKRKVYFSNSLFETVLSEPKGMTLGYNPEPILDKTENPNYTQLLEREKVLKEFLNVYCNCSRKDTKDSRKVIYKIFRRFMGHPHEDEVRMYGDNRFCDDLLDTHRQEAAAVLSADEIRQQRFFSKLLLMTGIKKGEIHESAWIEGSIVRNRIKVRINLRHAVMYKYFVYFRKLWHNKKRHTG